VNAVLIYRVSYMLGISWSATQILASAEEIHGVFKIFLRCDESNGTNAQEDTSKWAREVPVTLRICVQIFLEMKESWMTLCKFWGFHDGDYKECRFLGAV
jgi:hypothetical protein